MDGEDDGLVSFSMTRKAAPDHFERQKQIKTEWEEASRLFAEKPKKVCSFLPCCFS